MPVRPKILAFRHSDSPSLGLIDDAVAANGAFCDCLDLRQGGVLPRAVDADAFLFMGGSMSANDDLRYVRQELDLIEDAAAKGKPILGLCLGAQMIARALGGRVYPNPVKAIGWYPVRWTAAAARDPLFHGLSGSETLFQWHGETFDLPAGAELLATSDACCHQAYRVGDRIHGLQFHLEVTPEMIADWLTEDAACGDLRESTSFIDPQAHAGRMRELAALVFGRWIRRIGHA
ncbi:MAG TPA: type 1 glutamine amidotransferase [Bryobacteraceae bacterium]|nr:type 1 glutamine amidotransferase [Bryobacteraceae bacterium]